MRWLDSLRRLRALLAIVFVILVVLIAATVYVLARQKAATSRTNQAITRYHDSIRLTEQLRHSSDDLTRMVRSYAVTGDPRFKEYFYTILDIRDGRAPRPPGYERVFWDFVVSGDVLPHVERGGKRSLLDLMQQAGFSGEEVRLLTEAKRRSDSLVELEETAIHAIEGRFRDDAGAFTVVQAPDREMALGLLFGEEYHRRKGAIMQPMDKVLRDVEESTSNALAEAQEEQDRLTSALTILFSCIVVVLPLFIVTGHGLHSLSSARLWQSEERFRATFEQAAVGITQVSTTGRFLLLNDKFCDIVGYSRDELLARRFQDITHPDDLDADVEQVQRLLRGEAGSYSIEKRYLRKDGETVWVNLTVSLLRDRADAPRWFVGVVEDISLRKATEARLQTYQRRLRALAADLTVTEERERRRIAGELHDGAVQALALARMQLETAIKRHGTEAQTRELRQVSDSLRRTAMFANQIASNLSPPSLKEIGLAAAVSEWTTDHVGSESGIETELVNELEERDDEGLEFVERAILFRSVRELLANVVQHAHASKVRVVLRRTGDRLELVVRDDGVGCDPAQALSSADDGAGFGLFSIRERVVDLGGALKLESEPGQGFKATLVVPFPRVMRDAETPRWVAC